MPSPEIEPIASQAYPTPARRPAYSVLDCGKIDAVHGIVPPSWQDGLSACVAHLLTSNEKQQQRGVVAA
jgi:dTDP-4-dehydrorhamnose reductase